MTAAEKKEILEKLSSMVGIRIEIKQQKRRLETLKANNENTTWDNKEIEKLESDIAQLTKKYNLINEAINNVSDPLKREVLRMRYIDNATWKAIAYEFFNTEEEFCEEIERYIRRCYDLRNTALQEILIYTKSH